MISNEILDEISNLLIDAILNGNIYTEDIVDLEGINIIQKWMDNFK